MTTTDREIITTRLINAPRALVFAAWTDPNHVDRWWGPRGFTNQTIEMDVRPGGVWRYVMRHPERGEFQNLIQYTEVVVPERLAYMHGTDVEPDQFRGTVTFADEGGKTRLTMRIVLASPAKLAEARAMGAVEGGNSNLDRFEEFLAAQAAPAASQELLITRVFRAPRALVWQAWTEADHLTKWWGPKGFTMMAMTLDLRPGGVLHYRMRAPEGHAMGGEMWGKFVFREIVAPERLVFVNSFSDAAGNVVRAPFSPTWPLQILNTYSFTEDDGRTTLTMHGVPFEASEAERETFVGGLPSMQHGTAGMLDQLTEHLTQARGSWKKAMSNPKSQNELRMTRVFDAPKRLVFEAWSTAEHVARWFTPAPLTTSRCEVDLRPGGAFRLVMRMPDGTEHPMVATFIEVVRDERIVFEATIEGDLKAHTTVTFDETDGKTTLSVHQIYSRESPATRGALAGWTQTLDQLATQVQAHM